eukprot:14381349-Alexandrium_andersonii.AAC.1
MGWSSCSAGASGSKEPAGDHQDHHEERPHGPVEREGPAETIPRSVRIILGPAEEHEDRPEERLHRLVELEEPAEIGASP